MHRTRTASTHTGQLVALAQNLTLLWSFDANSSVARAPGFTDGEVDVATWDCPSNIAVEWDALLASSGLAGSRSQVPITHDLLGVDSVLVHVTCDSKKGRRVVKVRAMEGRAPQLPATKYDAEVPKALSDLIVNGSRIYTDGSWKDTSVLLAK